MASVPYSFNEKKNGTEISSKNGLSDIPVSGYYCLLSSEKSIGTKTLAQILWMGGGVKLATGKYNPADKGSSESGLNLFQLGTGSADVILCTMYDIRLQNTGIIIAANYKFNTANKYDFRYGNKFNAIAQACYKQNITNALVITPNAGIQYEKGSYDTGNDFSEIASGGNLLLEP